MEPYRRELDEARSPRRGDRAPSSAGTPVSRAASGRWRQLRRRLAHSHSSARMRFSTSAVAGGAASRPALSSSGRKPSTAISPPRSPSSLARPDGALLAALRAELPDSLALPDRDERCRRTGPVATEPLGIQVEAMEGFAVLRACALAGVPAVEVRAVSNEIGEPDRTRWEIPLALAALDAALPAPARRGREVAFPPAWRAHGGRERRASCHRRSRPPSGLSASSSARRSGCTARNFWKSLAFGCPGRARERTRLGSSRSRVTVRRSLGEASSRFPCRRPSRHAQLRGGPARS